ncbi:hypothetical protein V8C34DRAFT_281364 [Trichoderma compactum]
MSSQAMADSLQQLFAVATTSLSIQSTNPLSNVWQSYGDMDEEARLVADDLLGTLAAFNDQQPVFNETVRRNFWDKWVFALGWDTGCTVQEPVKIRDRTVAEFSSKVGTIMPGMPRSSGGVKKNQNTPAHRLAGQPVFLRPQLNRDDYRVTFIYSDTRGSAIHSRWMQHLPGYNAMQTWAEAMVRWDLAECKRVTQHNTTMVAFWAECKLGHWLKDRQVDVGRPSEEVPRAEDHSKLVELKTCSMIVDKMTALVAEIRSINSRHAGSINNWASLGLLDS